MSYIDRVKFESLKGKVITNIEGLNIGSKEIIFTTDDGLKFKMYHDRDCCESVLIEEIHGDIEDILNSKILYVLESTNRDDKPDPHTDSFTWTFYRLMTNNGSLVIRWLGESNGYYSENVSFELIK